MSYPFVQQRLLLSATDRLLLALLCSTCTTYQIWCRAMKTPEPTTDGSATTVDLVLSSLDLTTSKPIYPSLQVVDDRLIDEIQNAFSVKRIMLYSLVQTLMAASLVKQPNTPFVPHEGTANGGEE